jgi:putative chitinase
MNIDRLKGHVPDSVIAQIPGVMEKFGVNTPLRLSHFLAQCGHESGGFRVFSENLNYSAKGLVGIFKKYFKRADGTVDEPKAAAYARQPIKIANLVYGNRMGNGPEASGDGYKYRGRGAIQLTGKSNYTAFFKAAGLPPETNPDVVSTQYALLSAAWFWSSNGLNKLADGGATDAVVTSITKRVNGGTIGLPDRIKHFKEYHALLV